MGSYADYFEKHEVNGRRLALIEPSDLEDTSIDSHAAQQLIYKSIQNLLNVVSVKFLTIKNCECILHLNLTLINIYISIKET